MRSVLQSTPAPSGGRSLLIDPCGKAVSGELPINGIIALSSAQLVAESSPAVAHRIVPLVLSRRLRKWQSRQSVCRFTGSDMSPPHGYAGECIPHGRGAPGQLGGPLITSPITRAVGKSTERSSTASARAARIRIVGVTTPYGWLDPTPQREQQRPRSSDRIRRTPFS